MRALFSFLLLPTLLVLSFSSCCRCVLVEPVQPPALPPLSLKESGAFKPKADEPYDLYLARIKNTLVVQEYEMENYKRAIAEKSASLNRLGAQVQELREEQDDLRRSLAKTDDQRVKEYHKENAEFFNLYKVTAKDTLQNIAFDKYGTHTAWLMIYRLNMLRLKLGPNQLEVGDLLLLPNPSLFSSHEGEVGLQSEI